MTNRIVARWEDWSRSGLEAITDRQRYIRLEAGRYRYESVDSDFTPDLEVDDQGLVTAYPGLFRRVLENLNMGAPRLEEMGYDEGRE